MPVYVADYVLGTYGTGRDHGRARRGRARLRVRPGLRPADRAHGRAARPASTAAPTAATAPTSTRASLNGLNVADAKVKAAEYLVEHAQRRGEGQLPPARLARLAPALLGLSDPDRLLRRRRRSCRCPLDQLPVLAPDDVVDGQERPVAARDPRGVPPHDLPDVRRAGPARDRHDGHLHRLLVVLPALRRSLHADHGLRPGAGRQVDAGRPVHRGHRARDSSPALRALLPKGPRSTSGSRRDCRASRSSASSPRA